MSSGLFFFIDTSTNTSYFYYSTLLNWNDAVTYCEQHFTQLASLYDLAHISTAKSLLVSAYTWMGLVKVVTWDWTDNTDMAYIPWRSGEPDNLLINEDCAYLSDLQAADAQCSDIKDFFCYEGEFRPFQSVVTNHFIIKNQFYVCLISHKRPSHEVKGSVKSGHEQSCSAGWNHAEGGFVYKC